MIEEKDLVHNNYVKFTPDPFHIDATCFYQKTVWDESKKAKKYFINVYGYDLSLFLSNRTKIKKLEFCFEARFYARTKREEEISFDTKLHDTERGLTVKEMEQWFETVWKKLGCE